MRAALSCSAGERVAVAVLRRRDGRLVELTEREGVRDERREAMSKAVPAWRVNALRICSAISMPLRLADECGLSCQRRCCRDEACACCRGMAAGR